ncbi:hypothetical protein FS837_005385 [Tulasnella sp. UAMH 9824]|nr:hypothetical protein FS837_005385 [Tulasnella sp. UAMH 9824]
MVVVPVPVGPTGPVVECRVPATRIPVPPETRPRRPLVRRPVLKSSISRLGGTNNQIAPQPVTKPVQPPRPGAWIEWMSVEGKLVLYSHHTGPNGSLEWTVQFFPRREHWYYLPQYPASPSLNPLLELLFTFRPFVAKIPGPMMDEVCDRIFSISAPLPPSRPETPDASTLVDMMKPPTTPTLIRPDSASEALVASGSSDTVNVNTNLINANLVHIPHPTPPPQRPKPSSSLRTRRINPTMAFSPPLPQPIYSAGRPSIASQHLSVTCIAAAEPPLSPEQAAEILLNLQPQLVDRAGRAHENRALRRVVDSGMELENEDAVNIAEGANPGGKDDITAEHKITEEAKLKYRDVMEEIKFKFRYGGNKHRRQMRDGDQENTEPCASSAY